MAEQDLGDADVHAVLNQVRGKAVPQRVRTDALGQPGRPACQRRMKSPQKWRVKSPQFVTVRSRPYPRGGSTSTSPSLTTPVLPRTARERVGYCREAPHNAKVKRLL